jgi:small subunit ribosomal protein S24e
MANVSKTDITAKLSKTLKVKEECISIFGLKTKFGGGSSSGFALVYDSADARAKYDSKASLRRVSSVCSVEGSFKNNGTHYHVWSVCVSFVSSKFKN